ncbi:unnamed protein product [Rotaria magnacalcarata]|uniref:Uncharacterized protein n=1 Tax=Rotaria magnacalcarata TaxID=392030 RepID=A0A816HB68_9BILA|nr:unnamed protein product [Rotaria magnacalcarata]CAF1684683.1 unnamed protein product [Rotaria magnacalcarata]CAF2041212.1 unnamed protein product [Rotaria magnacalcarata]CAF2054239.1 unnamed protein product [Rotaria magnacalcarata]CAF4034319.1 unnamed protein product [Rotaria magnacalcarata]
MTSLSVALSFLSHMGFSHSDANDLMNKLNNNMSRLMICSNQELTQYDLSLDMRLRLLRAIRCFHMEKWSKYLMNNFQNDKNLSHVNCSHYVFEKLIYHLIKYHIWIIYSSWTLVYIRNNLIITKDIDQEHIRLLYEKIKRLKSTIVKLKQIVVLIRKNLS